MKVLVVDNNTNEVEALSNLLNRWGYTVASMTSGPEVLEYLKASKVSSQIVIVDWMMDEMDGLELCKQLRKDPMLPYCFIILLSELSENEDIVRGLDAGADDYLVKPYNHDELQSRIRAGVRTMKLNKRLEEANSRLQVMASTDVLTGLMNRGAIMDVLHDELARSLRGQKSLAVVMIDIDHFKLLNDEFHHVAGDQILREFSQCLRSGLRSYDSVGRYGGEEFIIIMPDIPQEASREAMERLRRAIESATFLENSHKATLTASFGVAWGVPTSVSQSEQFVREADSMLFQVKENGRNGVAFKQVVEE